MSQAAICVGTAKSAEFQDKVRYYAVQAAVDILAEDGGTANHANRLVWAGGVIDGTVSMEPLAVAVTTNATIAGKLILSQDVESDLAFVIATMIDHFARG